MIRLFNKRDLSRALESNIVVPCPDGLKYDPYQLAAIDYAIRRKDTLIGDAPGVGKTIEAVGVVNLSDARRILIICPGYLKPNWRKEFFKWDIKSLTIGICKGKKGDLPETDVVIINYDLLKAHRDQLRERVWDTVIIDEAHKLKSKKADRTMEVFGGIKRQDKKIVDRCDRIPSDSRLFLTGTPALNGKPKELWNIIRACDPEGLGANWFTFAKRYCQLREIERYDRAQNKLVHQGWWWDGCENLAELQKLMRERFMIRRLKSDVMKDLKPKRRMVIPIESGARLRKQLDKELEDFDTWAAGRGDEALLDMPALEGFSAKMLENGLSMVEPAVEIIKDDLEEFDKIVCMVYHNEVAAKIHEEFPGSLLVSGDVPVDDRHAIVEQFQTDTKKPLLVGTVGSAGEGETMTASRLMILPERSWVPGTNTQAEDRIHRRGQTEQALYKHLVREGSLAERQVHVLIQKQEKTDTMLDKEN